MPLSQYARDQLLQYGFTAAALTRPTAWYLGVHTAFPGDTGTTILNEFTAGADASYARVQLTGGNALALSSHIIQNGGVATVGPAGGIWAAAGYLSICDAATVGNLWAYLPLSQSGSSFFAVAAQLAGPGAGGYAVNDVLTITSGGGLTITVDAVATVGGVPGIITDWHITAGAHGSLAAIPANPMAHTGGTGSGATWLVDWLAAPTSFQLNNGDSISFAAAQIQLAMG
jgi:hypothetical protein